MEGQGLEATPSTPSLCASYNTLPVAHHVVGQGLISLKIAFPRRIRLAFDFFLGFTGKQEASHD